MLITKLICPTNKYNIKCPFEMIPEGICVHNTANDATAMSEASYMLGNNNKTSFHAVVDDIRVVECLPFNRNAYHAGDGRNGRGNRKMIAIEICYSKSGGDRFNEAEDNAAAYIAYLLKKYGWGIDKVSKHQDYSGKYCPHRTLDMGWQRFLDKVQYNLNLQNQPAPQNKNEGGELEMARVYQNGSTPEPVYADTGLTKKIGSLNPWEKCEYLSIDNDRPLVRYTIDGTNKKKCGYVRMERWLQIIKEVD